MKVGDMIGKLFSAVMFAPDADLCVEVDGKVYRLIGDLRTEGDKIILQVNQDDVDKPPLPKRDPVEKKHPVGGYKLHENDWNGPPTNWQIPTRPIKDDPQA